MDRRGFLGLGALAATASLWLPESFESTEFAEAATSIKPKYPSGVISGLPGHAARVAWTVDDGYSQLALKNYLDFLHNTGTRLTFFVIANAAPWRSLRKELLPLVQSGQVQLANHTTSHPNLQKLSGSRIRYELSNCAKFIQGEYGVNPAPVFRPPYGYYDKRVLSEAAAAGFRTCAMWYGSLGDGGKTTPKHRLQLADQWMTAGRIVIGHANLVTSPADLLRIRAIIDGRGLQTATLNDIWRA